MVILDEVKRRLSELAPEVTDLHDALAIERSRVRLEELEQKSASPEFYDDAAASGAVFAEMGELKDRLEQYAALQSLWAGWAGWRPCWRMPKRCWKCVRKTTTPPWRRRPTRP